MGRMSDIDLANSYSSLKDYVLSLSRTLFLRRDSERREITSQKYATEREGGSRTHSERREGRLGIFRNLSGYLRPGTILAKWSDRENKKEEERAATRETLGLGQRAARYQSIRGEECHSPHWRARGQIPLPLENSKFQKGD